MSDLVVDILEDFLGDHYKHNKYKSQISFDCPACAADKGMPNGDGKHNLEINYELGVFKCWACRDHNNMSGYIPYLIKRFGDASHLREYLVLKPEYLETEKESEIKLVHKLPKGFISLRDGGDHYLREDALKYLKKRRVDKKTIDKFNIGFGTEGEYRGRVIIPSYDEYGSVNYYVGRAFLKLFPKYLNPEADKQEIIFNEQHVNWDATIYLVEGAFDHICVPNSIPLLGKVLYDNLKHKLHDKAGGYIVMVMDPDAKEDAERLYRELNYGNLRGRLRIIYLRNHDIAYVHEGLGKKGVLKVLKTAKKIPESRL